MDYHLFEYPTAYVHHSPKTHVDAQYEKEMAAYLPFNMDEDDFDSPVDLFSSDNFRMLEFKVKKCARVRSHDWTECPFAHHGEKARRRDLRKHHYASSPCPGFKKGGACKRGDSCEYAHGVFECWLHPARYRTQPCKDGTHCRRRICFFAHTPQQLRVLPYVYSPPPSPPMSAGICLHLNKANSMGIGMSRSPRSRALQIGSGYVSPGMTHDTNGDPIRPGLSSTFDMWEEEPVVMVEWGKQIRERIYAKLSKQNSMDSVVEVPDFGWVSELVK